MCSIIGYLGSSISAQDLRAGFDKTISRGPDDTRMLHIGAATLGFHRLAIMGLHPEGMQPFTRDGSALVCNGEIYGFRPIRERLIAEGETFESESDCEILLPLYEREGLDMFRGLDAEFAMVIYDARRGGLVAARDPIGIRPLYYGYDAEGAIVFASEAKNLVGLVHDVMPFPPGHYYADGKFTCYRDMTHVDAVCEDDLETVCTHIREKLIAGVENVSTPTRRSASYSRAVWTAASCAPSRQSCSKSPSARSPSACAAMPSTSSTPARWRSICTLTTPRSSSRPKM